MSSKKKPSRPPRSAQTPAQPLVAAPRTTPTSRPWGLIAFVAMLCVAYWARRTREPHARRATPIDASQGRSTVRIAEGVARSGEIVSRLVELPLPSVMFTAEDCLRDAEAWRFTGRDLEGVDAFVRWAGVSAMQVARIRERARCDAGGCTVMPDVELLSSLRRETRDTLYRELSKYSENRLQMFPAHRPVALGAWSELPSLSPEIRAIFAAGTWRDGDRFAFSDLPWLCNAVSSDALRVEALQALRSRYTLRASVRVPAGDLEPLVRYWSTGSDPDEIRRALLDARAHDGLAPVAALLPAMARVRLDRYPLATDPEYDCFWSSVNFFEGPTPSNPLLGARGVKAVLQANYAEVSASDARFGDLVVFEGADGHIAHTCNFVAEDLYFSKNGRTHRRPWALLPLAELAHEYPHTTRRLYRLR
jgi:hypothetical protein